MGSVNRVVVPPPEEFRNLQGAKSGGRLPGGRFPGARLPGAPLVEKQAALTLSCDHRVIDGAVGAAFLNDLRLAIENPITLLY